MNTEQQSPENFEISSPTILNDLRKCSSSYVSENPFLDTDPMTLVKQAWDLVSYQLANTHQKQPGEFHFRLFKCMQENQEKFGSPQISSSTKYDRLDKEMGDSELRLIRQRTQEFYDNNEDNDELIGYRSRALNQMICKLSTLLLKSDPQIYSYLPLLMILLYFSDDIVSSFRQTFTIMLSALAS